jgi:nicotinate-nucleotide--dimethylbenzimidazole phosphoribosyltransferase
MKSSAHESTAAARQTNLLGETIAAIEPIENAALRERIQRRLDDLTKPRGSLGRLEDLAIQYGLVTQQVEWLMPRKSLFVFCGDHGVTAEGVSAFPAEVTYQMVRNFAAGGAAISVLCRQYDIDPVIVDMGVAHDIEPGLAVVNRKIAAGTKNFAREPAMSREQAVHSLETGIRLAQAANKLGYRLLAVGEMGIGNTTAASAVIAAMAQCEPLAATGAGTGIDEQQRQRKAAIIERALDFHKPAAGEPLDVLRTVGGFEIGGMAGFLLGASAARIPVCIDGLIATAAALIAARLSGSVRDYLFFGHRSAEPGHRIALENLGGRPLLDLDMRLGEGTGAALAIGVVDSALKLYREMATFSSAGVSDKDAPTDA